MPAYVVRPRTLSPHIRPHRPTVWDVTEAHTTRPVPYGVHTSAARARVHAERLTRRAQQTAQDADRAEETERVADRARIRARLYREWCERAHTLTA